MHSLTMTLAITLLAFNPCAAEQPNKNSGIAGVARSEAHPPAATSTPTQHRRRQRRPRQQAPSPTGGNVIRITDRNYRREVVQSRTPVMIHFWARWSAPDRMLAPTVEAIANEYAGRVKVGKVDVDKNARLARRFGVKGIPTIVVIKDGKEVERVVGATSKEAIGRMLDKHLGSNP